MRFKYVPSIPQCNNHSPYHKNQNISPTDALYIHNFWTAVLFAHFQIFRRSNHRYFWSHLTLPTAKAGDSCFFHYCIDKYLTVLQCLIQCPQAMFILFPYALRYSFSSLCRLHLQCFFQNINACIRIPVMNCMAFRALPDTNAQIFYWFDRRKSSYKPAQVFIKPCENGLKSRFSAYRHLSCHISV